MPVAFLFVFVASIAETAAAATDEPLEPGESVLQPSAVFLQVGDGNHTRSVTAGLSWDLAWRHRWAGGELSADVDASLGGWCIQEGGLVRSPWVTQIGLPPVLRWSPRQQGQRRFLEVGVGVNVLTPVFNDHGRPFSTAFNFGDHLAVGKSFGIRRRDEIALRVQHYSNGGIRQPNPGINFVQARYSHGY
jgi:hypothetical protein